MIATQLEPALYPDQPIIDAHHHLWDYPPHAGFPDFPAEVFADIIGHSGHNVVATVYVEAKNGYRTTGAEHLRGRGETEYARAAGEALSGSAVEIAKGIVTNVDLRLDLLLLHEALAEHRVAGGGRLRGVRQISAWDEDPALCFEGFGLPRDALSEEPIHAALRAVAAAGLSYDAWMHYHQLPDLCIAAAAVPELRIVADHFGGPLLVGAYADRSDEVFAEWSRNIDALSRYPNVSVKLGGLFLGSASGFDPALGSAELAYRVRPWFDHVIDRFGVERCMFESNFPVDGMHIGYDQLWNAFKRFAESLASVNRSALFFDTAKAFYRL